MGSEFYSLMMLYLMSYSSYAKLFLWLGVISARVILFLVGERS